MGLVPFQQGVANLRNLEMLHIDDCPLLGDGTMSSIGGLTKLKEFVHTLAMEGYDPQITDRGFAALSGSTHTHFQDPKQNSSWGSKKEWSK